jgi:hypothetical protein
MVILSNLYSGTPLYTYFDLRTLFLRSTLNTSLNLIYILNLTYLNLIYIL